MRILTTLQAIISLLIFSSILNAQLPVSATNILDANNISVRVSSEGNISYSQHDWTNLFEFPKGSGINALFGSSFWLSGLDAVNNPHVAANLLNGEEGSDFFFGPVANTYNSGYDIRYNRVWKINASTIANHIAHLTDPGYVAPAEILEWPGNGNTANGEADQLAPFYDVNNDGTYTPLQGDYPLIFGSQALFIIFNDVRQTHTSTHGHMLGVEIHMMVYSFDAPQNTAINNALFINLRIHNRLLYNLHNVKIGWGNNFDLGNPANDRMGCDTVLNTFFCYNGSLPDEDVQGINGYGNNRVVLGATFLNTPLLGFLSGNRNQHPNAEPRGYSGVYNALNCLWPGGYTIHHGGFGFDFINGSPTCYVFSENPCDTSDWYDGSESSGNIPLGDRSGYGVTGTFDFPSGSTIGLDMAYIFAIGDSNDPCIASGVTALKEAVPSVNSFYRQNNLGCLSPFLSVPETSTDEMQILCYPNPAINHISVDWSNSKSKVRTLSLLDINGRILKYEYVSDKTKKQFDTETLHAGLYIVVLENQKGEIFRKKVLIHK